MNKINNKEALAVLSFWTALEVLSYQSFKDAEDLVKNTADVILSFKDGLPWQKNVKKPNEEVHKKPQNSKQTFYEIVIGTIDAKKALTILIQKYKNSNEEFNIPSGKILMATVIVNCEGYVVQVNLSDSEGNTDSDNASVAASSFAWGVPMALLGNLRNLAQWRQKEKEAKAQLSGILLTKTEPLSLEAINKAFDRLVELFNIPKDILQDNKFIIKMERGGVKGASEADIAPQPRLINSFYLGDLLDAEELIKTPASSNNLHKYLGINLPNERFDILRNDQILEQKLSPEYIPRAKWPAPGRNPLSLLQQAAVNVTIDELDKEGILAINGPPGTGKTTLLRDIVAQVITARAKCMMEYDNPSDAFTLTDKKVAIDRHNKVSIYELDKKLKGFEILIASSNNKAVENVSAELPSKAAIAKDITDLHYFNCLSDELLGLESWGLVSAILGSSKNRNEFYDKFWKNQDVGMSQYLKASAARDRKVARYEVFDEKIGKYITKTSRIVVESHSPLSQKEAKNNWAQARDNFARALKRSDEALIKLEELRKMLRELEEYESAVEHPYELNNLINVHLQSKPGFLRRFFKTPSAKVWQQEFTRLINWQSIKEKVDFYLKTLQPNIINNDLLEGDKGVLHTTSPWCDAQTHLLRDEVFIAAINLHKAFIDMAATPLLSNLRVFMQGFTKQKYSNDIRSLLLDLWASFFLIVPSVSTTFASVENMLRSLPKKSLGWLLIDEAGQASPQFAVGAIMRTKRVIVTGDPMQLEPVSTIPESLVKEICKQFEVDMNRFSPPMASAQTLADAATPYFAEIMGDYGSREVGLPLLVHRRCADPMFSVANAIAYDRLMVHAKFPKDSSIKRCLGPSRWFDVPSQTQSESKWYQCEGKKVIELLLKLKEHDIFPDLYIISPFKEVAYGIKSMIGNHLELSSWQKISGLWLSTRVGTIHTTQGREAEAIVLVLGAQGVGKQEGSRAWAGATPNLLNVAITRAKEVIYVIGHKERWSKIKYFSNLHTRLESQNTEDKD